MRNLQRTVKLWCQFLILKYNPLGYCFVLFQDGKKTIILIVHTMFKIIDLLYVGHFEEIQPIKASNKYI